MLNVEWLLIDNFSRFGQAVRKLTAKAGVIVPSPVITKLLIYGNALFLRQSANCVRVLES